MKTKLTIVDIELACWRSQIRMEWSHDAVQMDVSSIHTAEEMPSLWPDNVIKGTWLKMTKLSIFMDQGSAKFYSEDT